MRARWSVVLVVLAAAACGSDDDSAVDGTTTTAAPPTTVLAPEGFPITDVADREQARLEIVSPDWLVADESGVWVKRDDGVLDKIDPDTNEVVESLDISAPDEVSGAKCQGLGIGFGSLWTCAAGDVLRIDPERAEVTATYPVGKTVTQGRLATDFDRVWVLTGDGGTLLGIDPETGATATTAVLGARGTDLNSGEAGLWVVSKIDGQVLRIDPDTGEVLLRITDIPAPASVVVTDEVWVGSSRSTDRLDPDTGEVVVTSEIAAGSSGAILPADDGVWVRSAERFLVRLDADGAPVEGIASPDTPSGGDVVVAFGSLWVTAYDDGTVFRLSLEP